MLKCILVLSVIALSLPTFAASKCLQIPHMVNKSESAWDEEDAKLVAEAMRNNQCPNLFPQSPCIFAFVKEPNNRISVVCGEAMQTKEQTN